MSPKPGRKPYLSPQEKRRTMSICIAPETRTMVEAEAERTGQSMSHIIDLALRAYLGGANGGR